MAEADEGIDLWWVGGDAGKAREASEREIPSVGRPARERVCYQCGQVEVEMAESESAAAMVRQGAMVGVSFAEIHVSPAPSRGIGAAMVRRRGRQEETETE